MLIRPLTTERELQEYDAWVQAHPEGSLWQSVAWKRYQEALGREVRIYVSDTSQVISHKSQVVSDTSQVTSHKLQVMSQTSETSIQKQGAEHVWDMTALVVIDRTFGGYSTWEIARGPLMRDKSQVISHKCAEFFGKIVSDAKSEKCIAIYMSPTLKLMTYDLQTYDSSRYVHPHATRVIDLTPSEEQILAQMHQKGRYNIKVAEKAGVTVRNGSLCDIDAFYALLQGTGNRDGFKISQKLHYARFLEVTLGSFILIAEHEKKPIAGLIGVVWPHPSPLGGRGGGGGGIYYYGASSYEHRNLMAPYILQFEAMKLCKASGCKQYDLLGVSPEPAPKNDPWIGISDFKRKFGGTIVTYPKEQQIILKPLVHWGLQLKRAIVG